MINQTKTPLHRPNDNEFLGYIVKDITGWQAQTIFGYLIERTTTKAAAEKVLKEQGLTYLTGIWQYYDKDDHAWFACVLKEANKQRVTVIRTNDMGYQTPDDFKMVTLLSPTENTLIKSS